ncbi:orotate phosphoribosyltransferase [Halobacillus rhizosphaerae]|uniref:orotate phosphoribosyltransferase n=1 Tax=Halobacillus rhizosphaerae TaxID=3064889 RepID=UPI00398B7088
MGNNPFINDLLQIGSVQIKTEDFFTWTSGLKSPIYCDNRLTMSYPSIRKRIAEGFAAAIRNKGEKIDVIAGCATAGIPHAAWVADLLELPMVYVRSSPKKHGKGNRIEGVVEKGSRAIVIEDLISTGKSSIEAAEALQNEGVEIVDVLSIFTYNLTLAEEAFKNSNLTYQSLAAYDELLTLMKENEELSAAQLEKLEKWKADPQIFTES